MDDLVSKRTRGRFRTAATGCVLRVIDAAFQDEGFTPNPDSAFHDGSARRTRAQQYLDTVDWTSAGPVHRAIRAMERALEDAEDQDCEKFWSDLAADGFHRNATTGRVQVSVGRIPDESLATINDPAVIRIHLDRLQRNIDTDPELAIGVSKELIESTAKAVLHEREVPFSSSDSVAQLATRAQEALGLRPQSGAQAPDNSAAVKRILGGALSIATGLAELRNTYGTGHGRHRTATRLGPRHGHLAANAAYLWCGLTLDTLADTTAPWRTADADVAHQNPSATEGTDGYW